MSFLGIDWSPVRTQYHRLRETLAILFFNLTFMPIAILCTILLVRLLFTRFYPVSLAYLAWLVWDRECCNRGGRHSRWTRSWSVWRYFRDHFPIHLVKTCELPPNKNYILGYHPHGIMCMGAFCNFATEATDFSRVFPGIRPHFLVLGSQFWYPVQRDLMLSLGMCSPSRESLDWILGRQGLGNAAALVIGGAVEALDAHPGNYRLVLNRRRGFVRVALIHGASLVPVIAFGENELFVQAPNPEGSALRLRQVRLFKRVGFAPTLFHGRGILGFPWGWLPYRKPIFVVVGEPLDVPQIDNPTEEDIDLWHSRYTQALSKLFHDHKERYADPDVKLIIT